MSLYNPLNWLPALWSSREASLEDGGPHQGKRKGIDQKSVNLAKEKFSQIANYQVQKSPSGYWQVCFKFKDKKSLNQFLQSPPPELNDLKDDKLWRHPIENSFVLTSIETGTLLHISNDELEFVEIMEEISKSLRDDEMALVEDNGKGKLSSPSKETAKKEDDEEKEISTGVFSRHWSKEKQDAAVKEIKLKKIVENFKNAIIDDNNPAEALAILLKTPDLNLNTPINALQAGLATPDIPGRDHYVSHILLKLLDVELDTEIKEAYKDLLLVLIGRGIALPLGDLRRRAIEGGEHNYVRGRFAKLKEGSILTPEIYRALLLPMIEQNPEKYRAAAERLSKIYSNPEQGQ